MTAKEICEGVPQKVLDTVVSDVHISDIASQITDWRELAPYLDISEVVEKDIVDLYQKFPNLQRCEALRKWKELNGPHATYRKLITVFCLQGKIATAHKLKVLLGLSSSNGKADVMDIFQEYLYDCYSALPHPSSLQWPFSSNTSYVELELYNASIKGDSAAESQEPHKIVPLKSLFTAGNSHKAKRKVILIEGVAGAGKTTLSWYSCKEWAAGMLFEDIKLLIHVSLSDPVIHSATKLADLIPHHSEEMRMNVAKAIADSRGKGVCFLLEGCDEAPPALWRSFLYRFVAGTGGRSMVPNANLILTSRPGIPVELNSCLSGKVVIKGFESLDNYFESCMFQGNSKGKNQLLEALEMKPELRSLCHLPLNAVILVHIYDFLKDDLPTTRTGLFDPLVRNFLLRHMQTRTKYEIDSIDSLLEDLPADISSSLSKVSRLAYVALLEHKKVVDKKMLKVHGITDSDKMLGLLRSHLSMTLNGPTHFFAFLHLSLQEFLAAYSVSQMEVADQIQAFEKVYEQNPLSPVLIFYAGLTCLSINRIREVLFQVLQEPGDVTTITRTLFDNPKPSSDHRRKLLALMNCIYETQKPDMIEQVELVSQAPVADIFIHHSELQVLSREIPDIEPKSYMIQYNFPLTLMRLDLYPMDCLSIAYFVRYVSSLRNDQERISLNLNACELGYTELKALTQELKKPAKKQNVLLVLTYVYLSTNMVQLLKTLFNPHSCLAGLCASGDLIENNDLALKYIVEGHNSLSLLDLTPSNFTLSHVYYLVLLVRSCSLIVLQLSSPLFGHYQFMSIFCESLKYSQLIRLDLDSSNINDSSLL